MKSTLLILALLAPMQDAPSIDTQFLAQHAEFTIVLKSGRGADAVFEYRLKNVGKRPILSFDPACLFRYAFPEVKDASGRALQANPVGGLGCPHLIVCIGPGRSYKGEFPVSLGSLYALDPGETYSVEFTFANEPSGRELRALEDIVHNNRLTTNGRFLVGRLTSNTVKVTTAD